ncbi:MAG: isoprenoid biosynthesis protein ElbB [Rhodocyclaceae bacterium]|nr:isoprenoid biosynthesis protein ElbB [Rhodocyclaceae bacterium]
MKAAVFLSGCGVFDGAEIQEAVLALLHLKKNGFDYHCFAPDVAQHHVVNHRNGEEMAETRNVLTEAARIARGEIMPLSDYRAEDYDAVVMPGGFGVAKNFTEWAFKGPEGSILPELQLALRATLAAKKPIAALCMAPTVLARAVGQDGPTLSLTIGTGVEPSPYPIDEIAGGMTSLGMKAVACSVAEACIDRENKVVTVPCYMMEADIVAIDAGVAAGMKALRELAERP